MTLTPRTQHTHVFGETLGNDTAMGGKLSALRGMRRSSSAVGPNERSRSGWGDGQDGSIEGGHETRRCFHQWALILRIRNRKSLHIWRGTSLAKLQTKSAQISAGSVSYRATHVPGRVPCYPGGVWCLLFRTSANDFLGADIIPSCHKFSINLQPHVQGGMVLRNEFCPVGAI